MYPCGSGRIEVGDCLKMKLRNLFQNKVAKNAGWLICGKIGQMIVNLLIGLLTARFLGPSNYGLLNYAAAYTTFFSAVCTLGINSVLVKELIDRPDQQGTTLGTALGLRAVASVLSAITLLGLTMIVDADEPVTIAVVSLSGISLIFRVFETFNYWFQSRLESKVTAMMTLIAFALTGVYKAVLLVLRKSVTYFACATSLDYLLLAVFLFMAYRKHRGDRLRFSWDYGKALLEKSKYFILPALIICIYSQTDKMMLKRMLSDADVGYYSTAISMCNVWSFVYVAIIDSFTPSIIEANRTNPERFRQINLRLYAFVFYLAIAISAAYTLLASPAVRILYGADFLPAAAPLRIITWYTAFSYLGCARDVWIVCKDCQKYLFLVYLVAALANIALNLLLIPRMGASGAALASLMTQVLTTFVVPMLIKPLRENARMMLEAITLKGLLHRKKKHE